MPVTYIVYNTNGVVVQKARTEAGSNITIMVGNMPSGNYRVKLISAQGKIVSKTFAVIH
jgi:hypothetical protein